ncbi:hypothetical protein M2447_002362 [Ereboglobus sp. PH5-10]|uniref:hypothetical protein n=1 Tax=Ereboglobus sp. PH5-10 TaxID=2940629 RepID=UPI0024049F38|nr:hypothetical protein [Ereboglobus sp. PH5-10]MDF9828244.1 hypothetical protein [Ereboglobus sp. PH5-10]
MQTNTKTNKIAMSLGITIMLSICVVNAKPDCKNYPMNNRPQYSESEIKSLIKLGDNIGYVMSKLGKPDQDNLMARKEGKSVGGRRLMYIYNQVNNKIFNENKDTYLRLWFNTDGILEEINYHHEPKKGAG